MSNSTVITTYAVDVDSVSEEVNIYFYATLNEVLRHFGQPTDENYFPTEQLTQNAWCLDVVSFGTNFFAKIVHEDYQLPNNFPGWFRVSAEHFLPALAVIHSIGKEVFQAMFEEREEYEKIYEINY